MNRIPRKPGLYDSQIATQRQTRAVALKRQIADLPAAYKQRKDFTMVPIGYIPAELREARDEQHEWNVNQLVAIYQGRRQKFTERGDFTHLSGRGV